MAVQFAKKKHLANSNRLQRDERVSGLRNPVNDFKKTLHLQLTSLPQHEHVAMAMRRHSASMLPLPWGDRCCGRGGVLNHGAHSTFVPKVIRRVRFLNRGAFLVSLILCNLSWLQTQDMEFLACLLVVVSNSELLAWGVCTCAPASMHQRHSTLCAKIIAD